MSSVRNVFIHASRAFGYQSCFAKSIREPNSEGRIIRNGGTPFSCSLYGILFRHQHAGTKPRFRLIAVDGKILVNFRAVIPKGVRCSVQCYICIGNQPFPVTVFEYFIKGVVYHIFHRNALNLFHLLIAVAEDKIDSVTIFIEYEFNYTVCHRHIVKNTAFFEKC